MHNPDEHVIHVPQLRYVMPQHVTEDMIRMTLVVEQSLRQDQRFQNLTVLPEPIVQMLEVRVPKRVLAAHPNGHPRSNRRYRKH